MPASWYNPPDYSCTWCEYDDDADHQDCIDRAQAAYEDAAIDRADSLRKGEW